MTGSTWEWLIILTFILAVCGMPTDKKRLRSLGFELNKTISDGLNTYIDSPFALLNHDASIQNDQYLWNLSYAPYEIQCPSFLLVRTANKVRLPCLPSEEP